MKKIIVKIFIVVSSLVDFKNASACNEIHPQRLVFPQESGGENIQEVTRVEKDTLCPMELRKYRDMVNPYPPNSVMIDTIIDKQKKVIYKAKYTFDSWGFRKTTPNNKNAQYHYILAGDSNTFGIGINDDQTIAHNLVPIYKNHFIYNMGIPASGPSNLLYFLENFSLNKIIPKNRLKGVMVYTFFDFLVERVIGSKNFIRWGEKYPKYGLDEKKQVYYAGTFSSDYLTTFYKFLNRYSFLNVLIPNLPRINQEHIRLAVKVLVRIKNEYLEQTDKSNKFIVVVRNDRAHREYLNDLVSEMKKEKLEIILTSPNLKHEITEIKNNSHTDAHGAHVYARFLEENLKIN